MKLRNFQVKRFHIILILLIIFPALYFLFLHAYTRNIELRVIIIGRGRVFINDAKLTSNRTLIFKQVKYGVMGYFNPIELEVKAYPNECWKLAQILLNGYPCREGHFKISRNSVLIAIFVNKSSFREPVKAVFPYKSIALLDLDYDGLTDYILNINFWNTLNCTGHVIMMYDFNTQMFYYEQRLSDIALRDPNLVVAGYPSIICGNSPWSKLMAPDTPIPIPARVRDLTDICIILNYSLIHSDNLPVNFAIESWFTMDAYRSRGVFRNEVELMIWLYWSNLNPAGSKIGELIVPIEINGTLVNVTFEVWYVHKTWHYFAFKICRPIMAGRVKLYYSPFIKWIIEVIGLNFGDLYLEDIELGSEFGAALNANLKWIIYGLSIKSAGRRLIINRPV